MNIAERCKEAALAAFNLIDTISAIESGGITPTREVIRTSKEGMAVKIDYTYPQTCGLSDRVYHIKDAGKVFTDTFTFKDGNVALNGGKLFEEPWCKERRDMQRDFFLRFSDVIFAGEEVATV